MLRSVKNKLYLLLIPFIFVIGLFSLPQGADAISGTYTSDVYNTLSTGLDFSSVTWTKVGVGNVTVKVHAGDVPVPDASWTVWETISNSGDNPVLIDNKQYVQYNIFFQDVTYSTTIDDVNSAITSFIITYLDSPPSPQTLTSSKYDTTSWDSNIASVSWDEVNLPAGSSVLFYMETASTQAGLTGAGFQNITGCNKVGQTVTCTNVPASFQSGNDDKWLHYRMDLHSGAGGFPEVDNVVINYNANMETPSLDRIDVSTAISYAQTGVFESEVYDTVANDHFNAMTNLQNVSAALGNVIVKARSCTQPDCSDGNAWGICSNISGGSLVVSGGCAVDGEQYIQYRLELDRGTDVATTPTLDSITIDFDQLQIYAPGDTFNIVADLSDAGTGISSAPAPVAKIYDSSLVQVGPDYTLYDDGNYGDDIAPLDVPPGINQPDGRFGTNPITINISDIYTIRLEVQDVVGNTTIVDPAGSFVVGP